MKNASSVPWFVLVVAIKAKNVRSYNEAYNLYEYGKHPVMRPTLPKPQPIVIDVVDVQAMRVKRIELAKAERRARNGTVQHLP